MSVDANRNPETIAKMRWVVRDGGMIAELRLPGESFAYASVYRGFSSDRPARKRGFDWAVYVPSLLSGPVAYSRDEKLARQIARDLVVVVPLKLAEWRAERDAMEAKHAARSRATHVADAVPRLRRALEDALNDAHDCGLSGNDIRTVLTEAVIASRIDER